MDREKSFEDMMEKLYSLATLMTKNSKPKQYGSNDLLFLFEVHTVKMIYENPGRSLGELAAMSYRTKGAMSLMIDKLVKKGIVEKKKSAKDERRYVIDLTEKGRRVGAFHEDYDKEKYGDILDTMDEVTTGDIDKTNAILLSLIHYIVRVQHLH